MLNTKTNIDFVLYFALKSYLSFNLQKWKLFYRNIGKKRSTSVHVLKDVKRAQLNDNVWILPHGKFSISLIIYLDRNIKKHIYFY